MVNIPDQRALAHMSSDLSPHEWEERLDADVYDVKNYCKLYRLPLRGERDAALEMLVDALRNALGETT